MNITMKSRDIFNTKLTNKSRIITKTGTIILEPLIKAPLIQKRETKYNDTKSNDIDLKLLQKIIDGLRFPTSNEINEFMQQNKDNPELTQWPSYLPPLFTDENQFNIWKQNQLESLNSLIIACQPIKLKQVLKSLGFKNVDTIPLLLNEGKSIESNNDDNDSKDELIDDNIADENDDDYNDDSLCEYDADGDTSNTNSEMKSIDIDDDEDRDEYTGELIGKSVKYSFDDMMKFSECFKDLGGFAADKNVTDIALNDDRKRKLDKILINMSSVDSNVDIKDLILDLLQKMFENKSKIKEIISIIRKNNDDKDVLKKIVSIMLNKAFGDIKNKKIYGLLLKKCIKSFSDYESQQMFSKLIIGYMHESFQKELKARKANATSKVFEVIIMLGELFNNELISINVLYRGIFQDLLDKPENIKNPRRINAINIELVCKLLEICGKKLDKKSRSDYDEVSKYISKMKYLVNNKKYSYPSNVIDKVFILQELRNNKWKTNKHNKNNKNKNNHNNNHNNKHSNNNINDKKYKLSLSSKNKYKSSSYYNDNNYYYNNNYNNNNYNNRRRFYKSYPQKKITAEFVCDITIPDRTYQTPGDVLTKKWKMKNSSIDPWGNDLKLKFFKGDEQMILDTTYDVPNCNPHNEVELYAQVRVPDLPGRYCAYYRLFTNGKFFGPRVWVDIFSTGNVPKNNNNNNSSNNKRNVSCSA